MRHEVRKILSGRSTETQVTPGTGTVADGLAITSLARITDDGVIGVGFKKVRFGVDGFRGAIFTGGNGGDGVLDSGKIDGPISKFGWIDEVALDADKIFVVEQDTEKRVNGGTGLTKDAEGESVLGIKSLADEVVE
ncbi:hypothetical protein ES705_49533 [subsurface metagenome]